ncbi:MAG: helix-turn-helix domain-containing protein [Thermoleophilia bacterium]
MRVEVKPEMLRWACERAGFDPAELALRIPQLPAWERGETHPTLKQLERFAKVTRTPVGYLFLQEPPIERIPIPDLRTIGGGRIERPSPDLLDTVYICQQRQEWYRDFARSIGEESLPFTGSAGVSSDVEATAADMRNTIGFDLDERRRFPTWTEALRRFIEQADGLGVLVMVSGIVGSNTRRGLDPEEFRGFALADDLAPLVFINGADTKAAQMFTLAHELAHLWLGESALSDVGPLSCPSQRTEAWCNRVAAEFLVPLDAFRDAYRPGSEIHPEADRLARMFKVSTLVIFRRIHDAGGITRDQLRHEYEEELDRLRAVPRGSGGDFYLTQAARVGKRFARALVASTLEGQTLHRDAFRLLGFSKLATFRDLGQSLGVVS